MTGLALATPLSDEQREYLQFAEQSARSLLHLLNDILDFSKIQAGKLTIQNVPFSLRECVERATGALGVVARKKGLEFRVLLAEDLPHTVTGDPDRLQQVIGNLVNNALKFTERGRIQVLVFRDPTIEFRERIHFSIRDTGQGIPRDKWSEIFEPFRQVDGSATRRFGGTGLGLSICSRLIQQMGGELTLDSEVGTGSTFTFVVPLPEPRTPKLEHEKRRPVVDLQPLRVLLVDGSDINVRVGMRQLERQGFAVTAVPDGREALELLQQLDFDIVLLDYQLLRADRLELIRDIRNGEKGGRRRPVIVLTTTPSETEEESVLKAGADAYLARPVQADDFKRFLETSASV
jgi:CheY-like chemotaxis protein/GGDEF domain-containing protein